MLWRHQGTIGRRDRGLVRAEGLYGYRDIGKVSGESAATAQESGGTGGSRLWYAESDAALWDATDHAGLSLRELIHEFKWQTLVLFKCALLQPKVLHYMSMTTAQLTMTQVLFFGSHCERLCMMQFALISLIPGLIRHLQDSADPKFNSFEENLVMPTSLKTSERASCKFSRVEECAMLTVHSACLHGLATPAVWYRLLVRTIYASSTA
jgi:hypothetical protein